MGNLHFASAGYPMQVHQLIDQIHSQACAVAADYRRTETELIEILIQVEQHRVFIRKGHPSLFAYVTCELGISESVAYNFITVARKARQVPALKEQIQSGSICLSNAKRIAPILTEENQDEWLSKAAKLSQRELEKEIFKVRPEIATPERIRYVAETRVKVELGLSEENMLRLKRVQDILSQNESRAVSLEEVLIAMTDEYLFRHDPLERAKRAQKKETPKVESKPQIPFRRESIPRSLLHQVNLRDERMCTYTHPDGRRCKQARWLEIHHKIPVSLGGQNTLENLTTLCSAHHDFWHMSKPEGGLKFQNAFLKQK